MFWGLLKSTKHFSKKQFFSLSYAIALLKDAHLLHYPIGQAFEWKQIAKAY
jgi:hypothetical protein